MFLRPGAHGGTANGSLTPSASREELFPHAQHLGVRVLHTPSNPTVDIILIHGLTGHPYNTFATGDGVYWPTQFLSRDLPSARILAFGYDADVAKFLGPVGQNNIREHAATLLSDVAAVREEDGSESRPIILVVHSLGGLVIKKALCLSEQAIEDHEKQLDRCTVGIAFLGTPHRGSDLAPFASGVVRVLKASRKRVNIDIVRLLERDSEALADIEASFGIWLRRNASRVKLTCFFEEQALLGIGMVVDKHSARIAGYPQLPTPTNHMDMVRFKSPEDTGYRRLLGELRRWLRQGTVAVTNDAGVPPNQQLNYQGCMKSLAFPEMNDRGIDISKAADGTCKWILTHPVYEQWLTNGRGLLWIKGKPGAGKSTIMKFLLGSHESGRDDRHADVFRVSFFFHGRGTDLQKSPLGLLRSLIHQIGKAYPEVIAFLVSNFEEKEKFEAAWMWRLQELEDALASKVLPALLQRTAVRLHIDALDEAGEQDARKVVQFFSRISEGGSVSPHGLSICFACRHFPIIAPDVCDEITVENENDADISAYIDQELTRYINDLDEVTLLSDEIYQRSQGVFQWVVLVTPQVCWMHQEGQTASQILEAVRRTPPELRTLYASIFDNLLKKRPELSLRLFEWVCFGITALSVTQLRFALALSPEMPGPAPITEGDLRNSREVPRSDEKMKKQLRTLSGGLAEFTESGVQLIHQSVQDFLLQKGFALLDPAMGDDPDKITGTAHHKIARSCLRYLLAFQSRYTLSSYQEGMRQIVALDAEYPLLLYAVRQWLPHATTADAKGVAQADIPVFLGGNPGPFIKAWETVAVADALHHADRGTKAELQTSLLHEAAKYGITTLITPAIRATPESLNRKDFNYRPPLYHAIEEGHIGVAKRLLLEPELVLNKTFEGSRGLPPFAFALVKGRGSIARLITRHPKFDMVWNLNANLGLGSRTHEIAFGHGGTRPAELAVIRGLKDITEKILAQRDPRIEPYDFSCLCWNAVLFRRSEVLGLLLPQVTGADRKKLREEPYCQILHLAAIMGEEQTVRQLLATDFIRQDLRDKNGATALHVAIKRDNWNVVKEFLESNADINVTDSDGNTPLILAINLRKEDLTRLLLSSTRVDPNAPDADLAMPLHIAIRSSQDHIAKMLLRCPNIMVNWRDKAGKTPLWDALSRGNNAIARILIGRSDIDLHLRDYSEQLPPLSTVNKDIVDRLEELDENKWTPSDAAFGLVWPACEADLTPWTKYANSVDISGNSLLCWAVMHRWVEAAKALLSCDLVDINTPNYEGMSPLMLALETGQAELARLLLGRADVEIYRLDLGGRDMLSYAVTEDMRAVLSSAEMRAMRTSALDPRQNEELGPEVAAAVPDSPRGDGAAVELVAEVPPWPGRRVHGGREAGRDERRGRRNGLFGRLANLGWRSARR